MPATGSETGIRNANLTYQLDGVGQKGWQRCLFWQYHRIHIPNGAIRSPDASWVKREKWDSLTEQQKKGLLRSVLILWLSFGLLVTVWRSLQQDVGIHSERRLAGLVDRSFKRQVYVYRA